MTAEQADPYSLEALDALGKNARTKFARGAQTLLGNKCADALNISPYKEHKIRDLRVDRKWIMEGKDLNKEIDHTLEKHGFDPEHSRMQVSKKGELELRPSYLSALLTFCKVNGITLETAILNDTVDEPLKAFELLKHPQSNHQKSRSHVPLH